MWRSLLACVLLSVSFFPVPALAAGVTVRSDIVTDTATTFTDNQYLIGGTVVAQGTFAHDVLALGGRIDIPGTVNGDVLVMAGETAHISGTVTGDVRVLGGSVAITGTVQGDVVAIGGTVILAPGATVTGEVLVLGGRADIGPVLEKHARIVAAAAIVRGTIETSANITTENLTFTDSAVIPGAVVYFSPREASIEPGATVSGSVTFNRVDSIRESGTIERAVLNFLNFWIVLRFVTTLILTFLLVYLFRVFSQRTTQYVLHSFGKSVLFGVLMLIGAPLAAIVLFVSLILLPVSILLMLSYVFFFMIASAVSSIAVGALVTRAVTRAGTLEVSFKTAAIGVVLLTVVQFVPIVGEATRLIFFLAALGAIWHYLYEQVRWRELTLFDKR